MARITPWWWVQSSRPAGPVLPQLVMNGHFFALETGERFRAIDCTEFNLYGRMLNEGTDAIRPVFDQVQSFGYTMIRVFTRYDLEASKIGRCMLEEHLDLYERIPEFADLAAEYGIYLNLVAYTSWNAPDHWRRLVDACLKCRTRPILSLVNELDQAANRTDPLGRTLFVDGAGRTFIDDHGHLTELHRPTGLLCSHGSNGSAFIGDVDPVLPVWDWSEAHWNASSEWGRKCGHNAGVDMAARLDCAIHSSELPRYPDNCQDVNLARGAGENISLLPAGGTFHSVSGKRGLRWVPGIEEDAALAFGQGAQGIPADCQPFPYSHRADLEPPEWHEQGRVYQRGNQPVCIARIPPEGFSPAPEPIPPVPEPPLTVVRVIPFCWEIAGANDTRRGLRSLPLDFLRLHRNWSARMRAMGISEGCFNADTYVGFYGDEIVNWTDIDIPSFAWVPEPQWPDLIAAVTRRGRPCIVEPSRQPTDTSLTPEFLRSLDAAMALRDQMIGLYLDETTLTTPATLSPYLQSIQTALRERGLPAYLLMYLSPEYLEQGGTGYQCEEINELGLGMYISSVHQNDPDVKAQCRARADRQIAMVGSQHPLFLVPQAYRQNPGPWANDATLLAIQDVAYEVAMAINA